MRGSGEIQPCGGEESGSREEEGGGVGEREGEFLPMGGSETEEEGEREGEFLPMGGSETEEEGEREGEFLLMGGSETEEEGEREGEFLPMGGSETEEEGEREGEFLPMGMWLNNSTEKGSRHNIIIYHKIWNMFENSDRVYMSTNLYTYMYCIYVYIRCVYMIVLTLQNSCALQYICCMLCGESWSVYLWCWGLRAELCLGYNVACGTENCCGSPIALPEM